MSDKKQTAMSEALEDLKLDLRDEKNEAIKVGIRLGMARIHQYMVYERQQIELAFEDGITDRTGISDGERYFERVYKK